MTSQSSATAAPRGLFVILTAISLSIGWGIRGNFGHEFGAMIAGGLAGMAIAITSGRDDWRRRVAYFGMFGALGWSFGGSISYMQVIAYTHSGHSPSVLYGFACLFVIGFLWAALGGAGTALPACLDRERLTALFAPITAVFLAWWLQEVWLEPWLARQGVNLDWYDTDWLADLPGVALATLVTGFLGGIGFAGACMLKLVEVTSGLETNWHSILEQTTGLFNGLALAVALALLDRREPRQRDDPAIRRWTEPYAVGFVLLLITYLNLRKNPTNWVRDKVLPSEVMYGLPAWVWFDLIYAMLALAILWPLVRHLRRPLALIPASWLGKGQWLYLAFLWWMIVGNFERALPGFAAQRLVTEGVLFANASVCTLLVLLGPVPSFEPRPKPDAPRYPSAIRRAVVVGLVAASLAILADWAIVRSLYGDRFADHASLHIRFGPDATTTRGPR